MASWKTIRDAGNRRFAAQSPSHSVALLAVLAAKLRGARWDGDAATLWDIAGGSMLFGCAAAIFSKPENIPHWFGQSIVP